MEKNEKKKIQQKSLELVLEIDKICQKYGIYYYLIGGSLIGALRHKGFIPWDDDLDIAMTRDHWNKFIDIAPKELPEGIELHAYDFDENAGNTVGHLEDIRTTAIYRFNLATFERSGVLIDILILDPVPDDEQKKKLYVDKLTEYADLLTLAYWNGIRVGHSVNFENNYKKVQKLGKRKVLEEISKEIFNFKEKEARFYAQRLSGSPHFWEKRIFGVPKYVQFENIKLPVPQRAGDCLCIGYDDDWMYVPQGGINKSTHDYCVMNFDIPSEYIMSEFEKRIDSKKMERNYVLKKIKQDKQATERYKVLNDRDKFVAEKIKLLYKNKKIETNLNKILKNKDFTTLEKYFEEYTNIQCSSRFIGSSALAGWLNWERKNNPILIDIGDENLEIVLELYMHQKRLNWIGKILKARRKLDRPLSKKLQELENLYFVVKKIRSQYECEEYNECRNLVSQYLPLYPDNPFLCIFDLYLKNIVSKEHLDILDTADKYLEKFSNDPEILVIKANVLEKVGDEEKAFRIYENLIKDTTHGFVLQNIKERILHKLKLKQTDYLLNLLVAVRKKMGEDDFSDLNNYKILDDSDGKFAINVKNELTDIQKRRMLLLSEVCELCEHNNIEYFLFGKTLWQAARNGNYEDTYGDLSIAMTTDNCINFIKVFEKQKLKNRYIDSMFTNEYFYRFCLHYCDDSTLDFSVPLFDANKKYGLYINIEILRNPSKNKIVDLINQILEVGWESNIQMKWTSTKRLFSYYLILILCKIFGRKRIAKWLFSRFLLVNDKLADEYFIKDFWKKRFTYPAYLFKYSKKIKFEGSMFNTMKLYKNYLTYKYGALWQSRDFVFTKENQFTRIVDTRISGKDFIAFLESQNIKHNEFYIKLMNSNKKYAEVNILGAETDSYWDLICACGERYRLFQKYMPIKTYLVELFKSDEVDMLFEELNDYYSTALKFQKKGIGICFDYKIFQMMEFCLEYKGNVKIAKQLRKMLSKYDYEVINLDFIKPGGGYGMREAMQTDLPAILTYLKRYVHDCLYMYIDIKKYGLENPNMKVWIDSDENGINLVVMKYHTGLNIFSDKESWNIEQVLNILEENKILSIHGPKPMIEKIEKELKLLNKNIDVEYGEIFEFTNDRQYEIDKTIELAKKTDLLEIANLVITDPGIGAHYIPEELAKQFEERMESNMGRNFIIRDNGKIIAHIASYAEFDNIATTSGLIVDKKYRNSIYGTALEAHLIKSLKSDGFKIYTFVITSLRKKLLKALGNKKVSEFGKIIIFDKK